MTTNNELEMLTNSLKNADNNTKEVEPSKKLIMSNTSSTSSVKTWYEKSEYLNLIYETNELSPSPKTWVELKKWFSCFDKEIGSSLDMRVLLLWIPFDDFMLKNNAKDFLAENGLLSKREFEKIWKNRGEELKESEFVNVYHEIESELREKFEIISYKREILVKIDNAYTNNLDVLLKYMNVLAKKHKVSYRGIKGDVLESLKDSRIEDMSFFCYDSWLLNFKNGYYNFITNKFVKAKHCTKEFIFSINRNYNNIGADCPIFKNALDVWLKGNKQINKNDIFEFMAYSLMFGNFLKAFFLNIGETNTGKTQIMEILKAFVPINNRLAVSLQRLTHDQFGTMGLNNKILIYYDDLSDKEIYDISMIKTITGGASEIPIEIKHGEKVDAKNTAKIWQNGNYLPKIYNSNDSAYIDRAIIIHFLNQIDRFSESHKEQFHLTITENKSEMNGIISELIKAGKRLYKRGNFRKEIKKYSKDFYAYESSEIFAFLKDFTIKSANSTISWFTTKDLVNEYRIRRKKETYSSYDLRKEFEHEGFYKLETHIKGDKVFLVKGLKWRQSQTVQNIIDKFN